MNFCGENLNSSEVKYKISEWSYSSNDKYLKADTMICSSLAGKLFYEFRASSYTDY